MRKILAYFSSLLVAFSAHAQTGDTAVLREPTKKEIFKAINKERENIHVENFRMKSGLNFSSQVRATWLNITGKFKHGKSKMFYDGEVITNDTYFPVRSWLHSPKHKSLILSNHFSKIGIGKSGGIVVARMRR